MLIIQVTHELFHQGYCHAFYELFGDCARDMHLQEDMSDNKSYNMFGMPKQEFLSIVTVWAMKKYNMFVRFNFETETVVSTIEVGWEGLTDEECNTVLLQMYPETFVVETQQQN